MKLFVDPKETIPFEVYVEGAGGHRIYGSVHLLARMSSGVLARVEAETRRFAMEINRSAEGEDPTAGRMEVDFAETHAENVLLFHNVKSWSGDLFGGKPANRENILNMDPSHPVRLQILEEIDRRNQPYQSEKRDENDNPLPGNATSNGSAPAGAESSGERNSAPVSGTST